MPILLALGLVTGLTSMYYAKKTIDNTPESNFHPQVYGYDTRNVGIVGGLVAAAAGAVIGIPLLAAVGLGVATGAWTNRDMTARVERGLRQSIRQEVDAAMGRRQLPMNDVPPPMIDVPSPMIDAAPIDVPPPNDQPANLGGLYNALDMAA